MGEPMPHKFYRSPLRFVAAAMSVVAAAAHAPLITSHLREAPYLGVLFVGFTGACLVQAVLLVRADSRLVWTAVAMTCAAAVAAYGWSRSFGLPQAPDDIGDWSNPLGLVSVASESIGLLVRTSEAAADCAGAESTL